MTMITVKCPECRGTGRVGNGGHFDDFCKACSATGSTLVSVDEANALLTQKQIKDAKL